MMNSTFEYNHKAMPGNIAKADRAYIAAGKWRCAKSPTGAHRVVYDAKGNGICRDCGVKR